MLIWLTTALESFSSFHQSSVSKKIAECTLCLPVGSQCCGGRGSVPKGSVSNCSALWSSKTEVIFDGCFARHSICSGIISLDSACITMVAFVMQRVSWFLIFCIMSVSVCIDSLCFVFRQCGAGVMSTSTTVKGCKHHSSQADRAWVPTLRRCYRWQWMSHCHTNRCSPCSLHFALKIKSLAGNISHLPFDRNCMGVLCVCVWTEKGETTEFTWKILICKGKNLVVKGYVYLTWFPQFKKDNC